MRFEKAGQNKYIIGTVQNVCPAATRPIAVQTHECQLFQKPMLLFFKASFNSFEAGIRPLISSARLYLPLPLRLLCAPGPTT
jgi:hypothetical protein